MRFEHEGMSVWYGTSDAPAPEGAVHVGTAVSVTIAVQPADASNKVVVLYRLNQGPIETIAARWLQHDHTHKIQHFRAHFPAFRVGDMVEYTAVCHCAGRQVPDPAEAQQLRSSFHIVAAEPKPTSSPVAEEAHAHKAVDTSASGTSASSAMHIVPQQMPASAESLHTPASQMPMENGTTQASLTQIPPATMSQTVIGEEHKAALGAILGTSPSLAHPELTDKLLNLYAEHQGPMHEFWQKLPEHPDFKGQGTVPKLQFTLQLGIVTQHHLPLINALQELHQQGTLQSAHDLTKLDANGWTKLINSEGVASVPEHIPGATHEEKVTNYVGSMMDMLHSAFPTTYMAQQVAKKPDINLPLVRNLLAQNPHINPQQPLPAKLNWAGISGADKEMARTSMEALRQEIKRFPEFDHTVALSKPVFENPVRQSVSQFLSNVQENHAQNFDLQRTHIDSFLAEHGETAFKGIDPQLQTATASHAKAMQRVSQLTTKPELQDVLLGENLQSAHSIASIPRSAFLAQMSNKLGGSGQASMVYHRAQAINAMTAQTFVQLHQAAYGVTPRAVGSTQVVLDSIKAKPDLSTLFGSLDFCHCEHCRSVYSPAAYFVDLLQFLFKSSQLNGKTPWDVLCERRPDLQHIKLSCENTDTLIPYVDLVNEILESYVAYNTTFDSTITDDPVSPTPTADELGANPQHTNVTAYTMLQGAVYPFSLPFNRSLEVARIYLEHLGSSRYEVMKTFQRTIEFSKLTPKQSPGQHPFQETLPQKAVLTTLSPSNIEIACEYLKISPEEYSILVPHTPPDSLWQFYGMPEKEYIGPPRDLGLGDDLGGVGLIDPIMDPWEKVITKVPVFLQQTGISYNDLLDLIQSSFLNPSSDMAKKMTLPIPQGADRCALENMTINNLNENEDALRKIYRFIRLWRRLGWAMRNLDRAIKALGATDIDDTLLENLAQVIQLQSDLNIPLVQVLGLWAIIDTKGDDSLYNKLFQNKAVLKSNDDAFKVFTLNDDGSELSTVGTKIADCVPLLLAALRITATDWALLWNDLTTAKVFDDASLINLVSLSTLYSYTALAKALKLSIKDLLAFKVVTMQDPFAPASLASVIEFVGKVRKVRQSGFSIAQLNYLLRHLYDPGRGIAPLQGSIDLLFKTIQDGLKKIASDNSLAPDPTGDLLRRKLSVVLDKGFIDAAMKLIDGSAKTTPANQSDQEQFIEDHFTIFLNASGSRTSTTEAKTKLLGGLSKQEDRFAYILVPLLDYLRVSLSQAFVKQTLNDALKLDAAMVDAFLGRILKTRIEVTSSPCTDTSNAPKTAMVDFLALVGDGLCATYFDKQDLTGTTVSRINPTIDFGWGEKSPDTAIDPKTFSARWTGKILAQYDEVYTFYTRTSDGVRLWVDNQEQPLLDEWHDQPSEKPPIEYSQTIALKAGQHYDLKMEYYKKQSPASAQLRWSSPSTPKAIIPQSQLYSGNTLTSFDQAVQSYYLLYKAAMLINTFKMTVREVQYLSVHGSDFAGFDFNKLPLDPTNFTSALFEQWEQLADFFSLRNSLPQGEVGLTDVFEIAVAGSDPDNVSDTTMKRLLASTGWDVVELATLIGWDAQRLATFMGPDVDPKKLISLIGANGFKLDNADFKNITQMLALQACLRLGKRLGISLKHLFDWASLDPIAAQAEEIKSTVKAKYDDAQWLTVAKSLNDGLRERQRDALIACLLQMPDMKLNNVTDSSRLYEHFLIDVDMSACMMTSRIVQALSTVQLFVQRCLMNLEEKVLPEAIDGDDWKWMKNYRVWEANRKVFLYPENWIEPELRDNKSPIFKELETELLQNDITMDTAEQAFLNYLEKLDQVARLEICGMYWEEEINHHEVAPPQMKEVIPPQLDWRSISALEQDTDKHVNVLYVFGRTHNTPHIYYYRQLIDNTIWTPWEKVNLDIEGDHLIPVVWNRRIHLFWPIFAEKADPEKNIPAKNADPSTPKQYLEVKFAWSEYKQNKWSPKQVSVEYIKSDILAKEDHIFRTNIDGEGNLIIWDIQKKYDASESDTGFELSKFTFTGCNGRVNTTQSLHPCLRVSSVVRSALESNMGITMLKRVDDGNGGGGQDNGDSSGTTTHGGTHSGSSGGPSSSPQNPLLGIATPEKSHPKFMEYVEDNPGNPLTMLTGNLNQDACLDHDTLVAQQVEVLTLNYTPSKYHILGPHQFTQFTLQAPFFYQDDDRIYFVTPEQGASSSAQLAQPHEVKFPFQFIPPVKPIPPPLVPLIKSFVNTPPPVHIVESIPPVHTEGNLTHPRMFALARPLMKAGGDEGNGDTGDGTTTHHKSQVGSTPTAGGTSGSTTQGPPLVSNPAATLIPPSSATLLGTQIPQGPTISTSAGGLLGGTLVGGGNVSGAGLLGGTLVGGGNVSGAGLLGGTLVGPIEKNHPYYPIPNLRFSTHFHPHVCTFIKALNRYGIPGLLTLDNQKLSDTQSPNFQKYDPRNYVSTPFPAEDVDFCYGSTYSLYNWELFFHIPMLIATKLSKNQRFEEAQHWFHYIFNPTVSSSTPLPQRYWNVLPFQSTEIQRIQDLLKALAQASDNSSTQGCNQESIIKQLQEWHHNPFQPHVIARLRLIAYQKNVVMKYIDNLLAWGDQLFRQDTIESINEATQLYILAYQLLGPRPQELPASNPKGDVSYCDLLNDPEHKLDDFSNIPVQLENLYPFTSTTSSSDGTGASKSLGSVTVPLFCIPPNDKLLGYWDTVADRLFKIRHCMNIEGVVRQLPLFAPPIDPALLVQAAAMGIDLNSVLNDINAALPHYRFTYLLQKAMELCTDLKALSGALLSALEKKDAEALAALRATQETNVLKAARLVKEQQLEEAKQSVESLNKSREVVNVRYIYYNTIEKINSYEQDYQDKLGTANTFQLIGQGASLLASIVHLIPNLDVGISGMMGSPVTKLRYGGANLGNAAEAASRAMAGLASFYTHSATMSSIQGGYERRWNDWKLQESLASKELNQIDQQIAVANIRVAIAQLELDNHDKQIENATAVEDFLRGKYTNTDLYDWMVSQTSAIFFQSYQLAYDMAKRAEKTFQFERGLTTSDYIKFGYWDSLKKGLLSGEQLYLDLKRLEAAYLDQNKRAYELTKHISLMLHDPMALIALKEMGTCQITLPEMLFDMDYPGHYMRRIKSVSLTIPCVIGPYTSINCTLTLLSNKIRIDSNAQKPYPEQDDDDRIISNFSAVQSIATSSAQNDSGMFEVNFRDERYLPFEGAGVVSMWRIDMPQDCNAFDFETISDVIIKLNYTARDGGDPLLKVAMKAREDVLATTQAAQDSSASPSTSSQAPLSRIFSAKHEFSSEWYRFLHPTEMTSGQQVLPLNLEMERFPFQFRGRQLDIHAIHVFMKLNDKIVPSDLAFVLRKENPKDPAQTADYPATLKADAYPASFQTDGGVIDGLIYSQPFPVKDQGDQTESVGKWTIVVAQDQKDASKTDSTLSPLQQKVKVNGQDQVRLNPEAIEDIWIVCEYSLHPRSQGTGN